MHLTALGALAVCQALEEQYRLDAQIKWPNDVLVGGCKLAGILAESHWQGSELTGTILGIGINVTRSAVPPGVELSFPATSIEACLDGASTRTRPLSIAAHGSGTNPAMALSGPQPELHRGLAEAPGLPERVGLDPARRGRRSRQPTLRRGLPGARARNGWAATAAGSGRQYLEDFFGRDPLATA